MNPITNNLIPENTKGKFTNAEHSITLTEWEEGQKLFLYPITGAMRY